MRQLTQAFWALVRRDVGLALKNSGAIGTALGFYLIVVAILPLGLGPDLNLLSRLAPGLLWVALLLSVLLTLDRIYHADREDGTLEIIATGPLPLELVAAAKGLAHWLTSAVPLVIATPVLGLLLNLDLAGHGMIVAAMLAGTPALSFLGTIGAALTLGLRRGGLLMSLVLLPLYIPTLIFGVSAVATFLTGPGSPVPPLLILSAISLASLVLGPWLAAMALRVQLT
jgi:heme exporter protein B